MTKQIKAGLYVVLTVASCVFGYLAYAHYNRLMDQSMTVGEGSPSDAIPPEPRPAATEAAIATTNEPAGTTQSVASAEAPVVPPEPEIPEVADVPSAAVKSKASGYAQVLTFGGLFLVSIIALGVIFGHDISHFIGNRFLKTVYDGHELGQGDPDYEMAEQVWADGDHLEAIRLMRDYLNRNPREQHVALRIAEIYEKDLQNYLAAALEYEEILKQRLPSERWGWAAIHLCNLYFKLNQPEKAVHLLRRIDAEHPETAAAEKARKRLALYDSGGATASVEDNA